MASQGAGAGGNPAEGGVQRTDNAPGPRYQMTPEEVRALQECNWESFMYRCLPLGVVFVGTTQVLVNKGFLSPHPKYGGLLKNMGAAFLAYIGGKMSYQSECREKILKLENSPLAEAMRRGKSGIDLMTDLRQARAGVSSTAGVAAPDAGQSVRLSDDFQSSDIDSSGNSQQKELDDNMRPGVDGATSSAKGGKSDAGRSVTSYDELRQSNREQYSQQERLRQQRSAAAASPASHQGEPLPRPLAPPSSDSFSPSLGTPDETRRKPPSFIYAEETKRTPRVQRNQYGDVVEE